MPQAVRVRLFVARQAAIVQFRMLPSELQIVFPGYAAKHNPRRASLAAALIHCSGALALQTVCVEHLTIEAAKKLYLRKVDPAIVSQLIEHPRFNELTQQLALYQEGTLAAGLAAQEQMIQSMTEMLIQQATNYPEDKPAAAKTIQALHAYNRPFHAGERQAIQQNFQKIVRDMGPDGTKEQEAKQLTKATMQQLTASLEKDKHSIDLHQVQAQQMITGITQTLSVLEVPEPLQPQMDAAKAQLMAGLQRFLDVLQQAKEMA